MIASMGRPRSRSLASASKAGALMVIPDNPQKRRDYEDNVIKTFYLSNAAPNDVVNTLRGLLDARRLAVNVQLNAITIRDTPSKIAVMERIIEANDKPPSEVVIDVEIVEVRRSSTLTLIRGETRSVNPDRGQRTLRASCRRRVWAPMRLPI